MTAAPPAAELATLLRLVGPADGSAEPLTALPWAPAGAGATVLVQQVARQARAAGRTGLTAATARRRPRVVRPARGALRQGLRDRLRRGAGSGFVSYLPPADGPSLLDRLLADVGGQLTSRPAVGADGAVRAVVRRGQGRGLLRIGLTGTPADPAHALAGLRALADPTPRAVPRVLADGTRAELTWVLEEMLPGRRPESVAAALTDQVAAFLAALPAGVGTMTVGDDAAVVAAAAPAAAGAVADLAGTVTDSALAASPQLRHGDLWAGNLLVEHGRLTGVVDWDAWDPAGIPAVDLLHLHGTEERLRTRSSLGEVWLRRPWDDDAFVAALSRHWPAWGADPAARAVVGRAWWLAQLAADLRRNPRLADDAGWVARNISAVTDA